MDTSSRMKKWIAALALVFAPYLVMASADPGRIYLLDIGYNQDKYEAEEVSIIDGIAPDRNFQPENGYRCEVISNGGEMVYSFNFAFTRTVCGDGINMGSQGMTGGCKVGAQGTLSLQIPYYANATRINIYDSAGIMVLSVDVSDMAELCGDGICQENESYGTCAGDCQSGVRDGYCDGLADGTCDADCGGQGDQDCAKPSDAQSVDYAYVVIVVLALLLVAVVGYLTAKKIKNAGKQDNGQ